MLSPPGDGIYGELGDMPPPGDIGEWAGEYPGEKLDAGDWNGENAALPGVAADPCDGVNGVKPIPPGVAPPSQPIVGVNAPDDGDALPMSDPYIPICEWPGTSIASLHFSTFRTSLKQPVPPGICCPSIIFSETPVSGSTSAADEAVIKISTVSSNEHLIIHPTSCRLTPCRVMAIK